MKARLPESEVEREGRRVLRLLMEDGALLVPKGDESFSLVVARRGRSKPRLSVSSGLVESFLRRDWIRPFSRHSLQYTLSDAGLGWVRRALAVGDPFQKQHRLERRRDLTDAAGKVTSVIVNEGESPLGWLFRRKGPDGRPLISAVQFEAGERLRADFTLAQLTPRLAVDLTAPVVAGRRGAKPDMLLPETVLAAKQRVERALAAVGPELADILIDVCCHLIGLEAAERRKGWPQRSAKVVLQIALDRLATHYGMGTVTGTGGRLRAWRALEVEEVSQEG